MGVRLKGIYKDYYNLTYTVEIIDNDAGSSPEHPFNIAPPGVQWSYTGKNDDPLTRILACNAKVTIFVEDGGEQEAFMHDLLTSDESRFVLKVTATGASSVMEFVGNIMVDQLKIDNIPTPYDFTINAVDPIAKLKDKEYRAEDFASTYISRKTFLEHIFNVLEAAGIEDYFGASDLVLHTTVNWYDSNMKNTTDDPLTMANIPFSVFGKQEDTNSYSYMSVYQAMEMICTVWNARFYYSQGVWKFEQITERATSPDPSFFYNLSKGSSGKLPTAADATVDGENIVVLAGGAFTALPSARSIQLQYNFNINENLLHDQIGTWTWQGFAEESLGDMALDSNDYRFLLSGIISWKLISDDATPIEIEDFKIRLKVKIQVGTKYLKREIVQDFFENPQWEAATWSDTEAFYYFDTDPRYVLLPTTEHEGANSFEILTPVIEEAGEILFNFEATDVLERDITNNLAKPITPIGWEKRWWLQQPNMIVVNDEEERVSLTREVLVYTNNTNNSFTKQLQINTGDGPNSSNRNRILVLDSADDWVESARAWTVGGTGTGLSIQRLLLLEVAKLFVKPLKQYSGGVVFKDFAPSAHRRLVYGSENYLFMTGTVNSYSADINATWFLLNLGAVNADNISSTEIKVDNINAPNASLQDPAVTQVLVNRPQYQYFENLTSATLVLDNNKVDLVGLTGRGDQEIRQRLQVYKNGQKLIYDIGYTIDIINNEINLNSGYEGFNDFFEVMLYK